MHKSVNSAAGHKIGPGDLKTRAQAAISLLNEELIELWSANNELCGLVFRATDVEANIWK